MSNTVFGQYQAWSLVSVVSVKGSIHWSEPESETQNEAFHDGGSFHDEMIPLHGHFSGQDEDFSGQIYQDFLGRENLCPCSPGVPFS